MSRSIEAFKVFITSPGGLEAERSGVRDGDRTSPYPLPGAYLDDHLAAVHERAQRWNWFPRGRGKVIWAELGIPPQRHTNPLPQRTAGRFSYPASDEPIESLRDVEAMRRV